MKKIFYFTLLSTTFFLHAGEPSAYGWDIPNTPINIGGYLDTEYNDDDEGKFEFDEIGLVVSANKGRFSFLSELEVSNFSFNRESDDSSNIEVEYERLQLSYDLGDDEQITIGRFNSDIGYWSEAPINIMQDTISEPHTTEDIFPEETTGLLYQKSINDEDRLSVIIQNSKDIGQESDKSVVDQHFGIGYQGVHDDFDWRVAGGFYRETDGLEAYYFGAGASYENDDLQIQAELFTQKSGEGKSKPYSAYIQSIWSLTPAQEAVVRLETYDDEDLAKESVYVLAHVYRPWSNIAFKNEYVHHTKLPISHFLSSLSVMF